MLLTQQMIISVSLDEDLLTELDSLDGFTGRSDAIRKAIRCLLKEQQLLAGLQGMVDAALLVVHDDTDRISAARHEHNEIIRTQLHNHLESGKCLEILLLRGPADRVRNLTELLQAGAESVALIPF